MKNLRADIVDEFRENQATVIDLIAEGWSCSPSRGGSRHYRLMHLAIGLCACCPRPSRPGKTKCVPCAEQANAAYHARRVKFKTQDV